MGMKIIFFGLEKEWNPFYLSSLSDLDVSFVEEKLDENNASLAKDADIVSVFVNSTVNKNVIDSMPNLKFITTRATGFDNIDYAYAATKGIKVSSVPAYGSHTVAEFAFGLILNLSRKIAISNASLRESLDYKYLPWMEGFDLFGKTLGVVGTGKIGKNVIKIAKGFGMNVVAYDLFPDAAFATENNFIYKTLLDVVKEADIVTLHAPYTKENHHLINKENIPLMKKSAFLINTARGELVDTAALSEALKNGIIAGAGFDVLENEKQLTDLEKQLIKMPNVLVTPHMAFFTVEAVAAIQQTTLDNIKGFIAGAPINLVK